MTENKNVNNQDDALKDTVNPDMENKQEPVDEQPKQEEEKKLPKPKRPKVTMFPKKSRSGSRFVMPKRRSWRKKKPSMPN